MIFKSLARRFLQFTGTIERPDFICQLVSEHPTDHEIKVGVIYVVGGRGFQKWAYFRCPTDGEEIIQLSLMKSHRPRWEVAVDWLERPTVDPSVRQTDGSFAHFWVKEGHVILCSDSGKRSTFSGEFSRSV